MKLAAIPIALVALASLVLAADPTDVDTTDPGMEHRPVVIAPVGAVVNKVNATGNNVMISKSAIFISKSDRVALAHTIKEMLSIDPKTKDVVSSMSVEDILSYLSGALSNPSLVSNVSNILSATSSGDTSALARNVLGLVSNAVTAGLPATEAPAADTGTSS